MVLFYISFSIFISLLFYSLLAFRAEKVNHVQQRIQNFVTARPVNTNQEMEELSFAERILEPFWKELKKKYKRRLSKEKTSKLEARLLQAGQPFGFTPIEFNIFQSGLMIIFPLIGLGAALLLNLTLPVMLLFPSMGLVMAIVIPSYYLKAKASKRSKQAVKELPDTLDLLTISLEGGLGFDSALSKVVSKKQGVLSDEFKRCLEEIRLGKTRKEALSGINDRLSSEELKSLIYNIVQAEKLGIGMVSVLRVQTEDIREQRKQKAEETAMKAPIKMMFPLVLFIFPTLFIILLGPAVLQFIESFNS